MIILLEKAWQFEIRLPEKVRQFEIKLSKEVRQRMIILPEKAWQFETNRPKKARLVRDKAVESHVWAEKPVEAKKGPRGRRRWWYVRGERVCRRSAGGGGTFEVSVSAGGLLEQGLPEAL